MKESASSHPDVRREKKRASQKTTGRRGLSPELLSTKRCRCRSFSPDVEHDKEDSKFRNLNRALPNMATVETVSIEDFLLSDYFVNNTLEDLIDKRTEPLIIDFKKHDLSFSECLDVVQRMNCINTRILCKSAAQKKPLENECSFSQFCMSLRGVQRIEKKKIIVKNTEKNIRTVFLSVFDVLAPTSTDYWVNFWDLLIGEIWGGRHRPLITDLRGARKGPPNRTLRIILEAIVVACEVRNTEKEALLRNLMLEKLKDIIELVRRRVDGRHGKSVKPVE